jgi:hypothetical protein
MTMIFDDVHLVNSKNKLHLATRRLSQLCDYAIGQSATPLVNSPVDLCYIANALSFPQAEHVAHGDRDRQPGFFQLARRSGGWQKKTDIAATTAWARTFYSHHTAELGDESGRRVSAFASEPAQPTDDLREISRALGHTSEMSMDARYKKALDDCLTQLGPYLIRRTKSAKDRHFEPLLRLGSIRHTIINVALRKDELNDIHKHLEDAQSGRLKGWSRGRLRP